MSLDGFSLRPLALELDKLLQGGRIDRITQPNSRTVQLLVRQPSASYYLCLSFHPECPAAYVCQKSLDTPSEPSAFCMGLRKNLEGGRIAGLRQCGFDRQLRLDIDFLGAKGRIVTKTLMAELMGKNANLILLENDLIIDALRKVGANSSRVRRILPHEPYIYPPDDKERLDALTTPPEIIAAAVLAKGDKRLERAIIAACQGFGPVTAKEIAYSAGLDPNIPVENLDEKDKIALTEALAETIASLRSENLQPTIILGTSGKLLAQAAFPLHYFPPGEIRPPLVFSSLNELSQKAVFLLKSYVPPEKELLEKIVRNEMTKSRHKLDNLVADAAAAEKADTYKIKADNLQAYRHELADHQEKAVFSDIYGGGEITVELDRRLTVSQNIQAFYKKYAKLKRAANLLKEQISLTQAHLAYLLGLEVSLDASKTNADIADIKAELTETGLIKEKPKKKPTAKPSEPLSFTSPDGVKILVGKNNYQNDRLTFKLAKKDDVWLHAKDIPGSHVIIALKDAGYSLETLPPATLAMAAQLALRFSQAKGSSHVPIDYTLVRFVKKPAGARPGFVIFTRQKTLAVTADTADPTFNFATDSI